MGKDTKDTNLNHLTIAGFLDKLFDSIKHDFLPWDWKPEGYLSLLDKMKLVEYSGLKWASNSEAKWASDWGLIVSKRDTERFTKQT